MLAAAKVGRWRRARSEPRGSRSRRWGSAAWACPSSTGRRRGRGDRDDPPRARARRHVPRHGRHLRPGHERTSSSAGDQGPARRGRAGHQVRERPRPERQYRARRQPRVRARGVRGVACGAWASTRSTSTTSTASTRRRRSRRRSARWPSWSQAGKVRYLGLSEAAPDDDPARPRRPSDHRAAERVLALDARSRGRDPADAARARHRLRRLQPAGPRLPHRPVPLG